MFIVAIVLVILLLMLLWLRFRTLRYNFDSEKIEIRYGIFIKSVKTIKRTQILWKTVVKLRDRVLFTVLHTAAGKEILFTDLSNF